MVDSINTIAIASPSPSPPPPPPPPPQNKHSPISELPREKNHPGLSNIYSHPPTHPRSTQKTTDPNSRDPIVRPQPDRTITSPHLTIRSCHTHINHHINHHNHMAQAYDTCTPHSQSSHRHESIPANQPNLTNPTHPIGANPPCKPDSPLHTYIHAPTPS
ncbi:hypothetical protein BO86DRAFT_107855 [Aspergillus japonicus CBS 114.51]|uniref:Uncharacterized protein n=1 Tax=Aspergillus japonicus CBS 114.51 TaxID=1448312 RepID=A0A8T8WZ50_ASPJA|nr:hypothetical protein BO86DRAFT_107855 [Aspergillus japonicus CBS 114.51]RAH81128.1 hypothetical protein BO86DRAFT_107855 [Aspergillus japonicus CBS 114.51]